MQHIETLVSRDSVLPSGQHSQAVSLAVLLLPHDGVVSHVTDDTRDERVIALVHVHWVREAVPDAGHARCKRKTDCLKTIQNSQAQKRGQSSPFGKQTTLATLKNKVLKNLSFGVEVTLE
jgi:hypothetical protein